MQRVKTSPLESLLGRVPKWLEWEAKYPDIVLFSRMFLYRNIEGYKFPERANTIDIIGLSKNVFSILENYNNGEELFDYFYGIDLSDVEFSALKEYLKYGEAMFKTEKDKVGFAISRDLNLSLITNADNHLTFAINVKEDSLREGYSYIYDIEQYLENYFNYSFNGTFGYLTSSLNDTGTGFRIKFLIDLPGVVFKNKLNFVKKLAAGLNMELVNFPNYNYGETSFFILTNKMTIGFAEDEIIDFATKALIQIKETERRYREELFKNLKFRDRIIRNYAVFKNTLLINDNEIFNMMSLLRLGVISGIIKDMNLKDIDHIFNECGRNYLRYVYKIKKEESMLDVMKIRKSHIEKLMRY